MRLLVVILAALVFSASSAMAQVDALPFTKGMMTKERLVEAVAMCDQELFHINCDKLVDVANEVFDLKIPVGQTAAEKTHSRALLAQYLKRLEEKPCPQSRKTSLARVFRDGRVDLHGFVRAMKPGERCLFDNNSGDWVLSLMCGNFITGTLPLTFTEEGSPGVVAGQGGGGTSGSRPPFGYDDEGDERNRQRYVPPTPEGSRHWWSVSRRSGQFFWTAVATGVVVAACTIPEPRCFVTEVDRPTRVRVRVGVSW